MITLCSRWHFVARSCAERGTRASASRRCWLVGGVGGDRRRDDGPVVPAKHGATGATTDASAGWISGQRQGQGDPHHPGSSSDQ